LKISGSGKKLRAIQVNMTSFVADIGALLVVVHGGVPLAIGVDVDGVGEVDLGRQSCGSQQAANYGGAMRHDQLLVWHWGWFLPIDTKSHKHVGIGFIV